MRPVDTDTLTTCIRKALVMSRRFLVGGWLLAFGNGSATTDAQHISVEFAQPDNTWHYQVRRCYLFVPRLSPSGITRVILRV